MPASLSLEALIHAMEQASGIKATVKDRGEYVRVSVPAPADPEAFKAVVDVLRGADAWGSTDAGGLRLWGAVRKRDEPDAKP